MLAFYKELRRCFELLVLISKDVRRLIQLRVIVQAFKG
jgi:hypothetical protein